MIRIMTLLLSLLAFTTQATVWDDEKVDAAAEDAKTSLNQYFKGDKHSSLYRFLSQKYRNELSAQLQFSPNQPRTFANLQRKAEVLDFINDHLHGDQIAFLSLARLHSLAGQGNKIEVNLAEAIFRNNHQSAAYAFSILRKLNVADDEKSAKRRVQLVKRYGFHFTGFDVNDEQALPEVCLNFSIHIRPEPAQKWQDFVQVSPAPSKPMAFRGDRLCFFGEWQSDYTINIDGDMLSDNRLKLGKNSEEHVSTGVRRPMVRFASSGAVLSSTNKKLAITTANVDNVRVTLWQLPANNLSNQHIRKLIDAPSQISSWRLNQRLRQEGVKLFTGTFSVGKYTLNKEVTTNVYLDDMLNQHNKGQKSDAEHGVESGQEKRTLTSLSAGLFVMTASEDIEDAETTATAFSLSNAGFSAYLTDAGLWAELRKLDNAKPVAGQTVILYARNNSILGQAVTDDDGVAHFTKPMINGKASLRPSHIISDNGAYFAYLNLVEHPIDLSDKGLSGELQNTPLRSWIWTDRGVYRPNDSMHVMWLLKTPDGKAFYAAPIWLELVRPDGKVLRDEMIFADKNGAYAFEHYFNHASRQGAWQIRLSLGKNGKQIAQKNVAVSAITPNQIEASITPIAKPITNKRASVDVNADWLYGAPASGLTTMLGQTVDVRTLEKERQGWQIGLHDEKRFSGEVARKKATTDAEGKASFNVNIATPSFSTHPLAVRFNAEVFEPSGKAVRSSVTQALHRAQPYLGAKAQGDKRIDVALIDDKGDLQAGVATWTLFRVNYQYYWYKNDNGWQWQYEESRQPFKLGKLSFDGKTPTRLSLKDMDEGDWVIVIRGQHASVATSLPMTFGRYASPKKGNAPDQIKLTSEFERYRDGDTVRVQLTAPFDGVASVKFALNDEIVKNARVTFVDGRATLSFKWQEAWKQGLWLLANAWNNEDTAHNRRAVGLHWLGGDLTTSTLALEAKLPELVEPNTTLTIPLSLKNKPTQTTWARVAVVDEGLYNLAKASFSNPLDAFWGKKQLNVEFFDVWGNIIRELDGRKASLRSGADGMDETQTSGDRALPDIDVTLLAFWSQPVAFDSEGRATVQVDLPQFNGRVRVMVAAWNDDQLGAFEDEVVVRAPLVSTLYLPKFLSPKDRGSARLRLHNTTAKPMTVTPTMTAKNLSLISLNDDDVLTIEPDTEAWVTQAFSVNGKGRAEVAVKIERDAVPASTVTKFMDIRPATLPQKTQTLYTLGAGKTVVLSPLALKNGANVIQRQAFLSTQAPFDTKHILEQLDSYPFGCVEQVTSKSWNNLLLADLIPRYALPETKWGNADSRKKQLYVAHSNLANRQNKDGSFSLWRAGEPDDWLSAYVTEFLLASKQADMLGNDRALTQALRYLRQVAMQANRGDMDAAIAYAHYVLAKAGEPVQGATMRFAETVMASDAFTLNTANVQVASALVYHGNVSLAMSLIQKLTTQSYEVSNTYDNYGDTVRDLAQSLTVLSDLRVQLVKMNADKANIVEVQRLIDKLWQPMRQALADKRDFSTQTLHWLASLATTLPSADDDASITLNGDKVTFFGQKWLTITGENTLVNQGKSPLYVTVNDWVMPANTEKVENGFTIKLRYFDKQGEVVDVTTLSQHQQVYVLATITADKNNINSDVMFAYPIPAGLTLSSFPQARFDSEPWRTLVEHPSTALFSENRDDRHLAAFHIDNTKPFTHPFVLTAAEKGNWHAPPYSIENMYQPHIRAVYPRSEVTVE